jgi:hypothetical protein
MHSQLPPPKSAVPQKKKGDSKKRKEEDIGVETAALPPRNPTVSRISISGTLLA